MANREILICLMRPFNRRESNENFQQFDLLNIHGKFARFGCAAEGAEDKFESLNGRLRQRFAIASTLPSITSPTTQKCLISGF
jgi:hypothetical protein